VWKCNGLSSALYTLSSTTLESFSYTKVSAVPSAPTGYTIAAEGTTYTNPSTGLRFAAAFEPSALIRQTLGLTVEQCTAACDTEFTCRGAFWYLLGGQWRCRLLNIGTFEIVPTSQIGFSLKRDVIPTTTTTTTTAASFPNAVFRVTASNGAGAIGYYKLTGDKEYKKINADGSLADPGFIIGSIGFGWIAVGIADFDFDSVVDSVPVPLPVLGYDPATPPTSGWDYNLTLVYL